MKKFNIVVGRIEVKSFEVEAKDYEEAREKALDSAYNTNFHDEAEDSFYMMSNEDGNWEEA